MQALIDPADEKKGREVYFTTDKLIKIYRGTHSVFQFAHSQNQK